MIQLLIGVKSNVSVVRSASVTEKDSGDNDSVELVGDNGCLSTVLDLINDVSERNESDQQPRGYLLHVALVSYFARHSSRRVQTNGIG